MKGSLILLAIACSACEVVLGFGETSVTSISTDGHPSSSSMMADGEPVDGSSADVSIPQAGFDDARIDSADTEIAERAAEEDLPLSDVAIDGSWSPLALSGLALWLDAEIGIETNGGQIAKWRDRTPNAHVAVSPYAGLAPTALAQGVGSHPGVAFAGKGDILTVKDHPSLQFGTQDFIVDVVVRNTTPIESTDCIYAMGLMVGKPDRDTFPYTGPILFANYDFGEIAPVLAGQINGFVGVSTDPNSGIAYNDDIPRMVGLYRRGNTLILRINGVPMKNISTPLEQGHPIDVNAVGYELCLGGQPDKIQCFRGIIAEVIAVSPVSFQETIDLDSYLLTKYASALGVRASGSD